MTVRRFREEVAGGALLLMAAALLGGCSERVAGPSLIANRRFGPMTVAVAPAINLSGSADFDPDRFADAMAGELTHVEGIDVIPVSRVLAALHAQGESGVGSAQQAWQLRDGLGADAILVFAVTEYDPYDPPSIGITAQLYGQPRDAAGSGLDAVAAARRVSDDSPSPGGRGREPLAAAQRTFDAGHEDVRGAIQAYARSRGADDNPFGWRKTVVSQREYIRFCCHETLKALMGSTTGVADAAGAER